MSIDAFADCITNGFGGFSCGPAEAPEAIPNWTRVRAAFPLISLKGLGEAILRLSWRLRSRSVLDLWVGDGQQRLN